MTKIVRPLTRETAAKFRGRPLVVELGPHTLRIREKGSQVSYEASYEQIFKRGAENAAEQARRAAFLKKDFMKQRTGGSIGPLRQSR